MGLKELFYPAVQSGSAEFTAKSGVDKGDHFMGNRNGNGTSLAVAAASGLTPHQQFQKLLEDVVRGESRAEPWSAMTRRCGIPKCRHNGNYLAFVGPENGPAVISRICAGHNSYALYLIREHFQPWFYYGSVEDTEENLKELEAFLNSLAEAQDETRLVDIADIISERLDQWAGPKTADAYRRLVTELRMVKHAPAPFWPAPGNSPHQEARA